MEYQIHPSAWGAMFALPASVTDSYLRFAGVTQLKVLLLIFRRAAEGVDVDSIANALKIARADVIDAMQYWIECGILEKCGEGTAQVYKTAEPVKAQSQFKQPEEVKMPEPQKKPLAPLPMSKPDSAQIAARINEEPALRMLYAEAQQKLGRTIGYDGQSTLLLIHDQYGLPVEVILMLIEYAASEGKTSMAYIAKVGREWGESEIDTLEKAEQRITSLREGKSLWNQLRSKTGIQNPKPTAAQEDFLIQWSQKLGYGIEVILAAYEEMANHTSKVSFPYMNKILLSWHEKGIRKAADLVTLKSAPAKHSAAAQKSGRTASYDLDEFTRRALHEPLVYEKGRK